MADASKEWARNGSFMKKPNSGWLHNDAELTHGDGVYYAVQYVGKIAMAVSMRTMRFEDRTAVTREAITLCCEKAGIFEPARRAPAPIVKRALIDDPTVMNLNVRLTVSTTGIALVVVETSEILDNHIIPSISFATGSAPTEYEILGYVAKDAQNRRECHVFYCGDSAPDVMATIGQAFELRYKAFLAKGHRGAPAPAPAPVRGPARPPVYAAAGPQGGAVHAAPIYDQAGRAGGAAPPQAIYDDVQGTYGGAAGQYNAVEPNYGVADAGGHYGEQGNYGTSNYGTGATSNYGEGNYGGGNYGEGNYGEGNYGEGNYGEQGQYNAFAAAGEGQYGDVGGQAEPTYGGQTYAPEINDAGSFEGGSVAKAPNAAELSRRLTDELWFHGAIPRPAADALLRQEGHFLIRESTSARGQYILSAISNGEKKHLLLVDPSGYVRTNDMQFENVSHLINYHLRARTPVTSRGCRISLIQPVPHGAHGDETYDSLNS